MSFSGKSNSSMKSPLSMLGRKALVSPFHDPACLASTLGANTHLQSSEKGFFQMSFFLPFSNFFESNPFCARNLALLLSIHPLSYLDLAFGAGFAADGLGYGGGPAVPGVRPVDAAGVDGQVAAVPAADPHVVVHHRPVCAHRLLVVQQVVPATAHSGSIHGSGGETNHAALMCPETKQKKVIDKSRTITQYAIVGKESRDMETGTRKSFLNCFVRNQSSSE